MVPLSHDWRYSLSRAARTDTSSHTVTCALLLLVNNPQKLEFLVAELDAAFPSKYDPITLRKAQDLLFLNAVLNERLRVLPVISAGHSPYILRFATSTDSSHGYQQIHHRNDWP
jgi:cytochrome P450